MKDNTILTIDQLSRITSALQSRRKKLKKMFDPGCQKCRREIRQKYQTTLSALSELSKQTPRTLRYNGKDETTAVLTVAQWHEVAASLESTYRDISREIKENCPHCPNIKSAKNAEIVIRELQAKIKKIIDRQ